MEFAFFLEQDVKWAARCAMDKSQGQVNPEAANRAFASPNIVPLFTFTPEDTKELYEAGMKLMERSQRTTLPYLTQVLRYIITSRVSWSILQGQRKGKRFRSFWTSINSTRGPLKLCRGLGFRQLQIVEQRAGWVRTCCSQAF
jgi:hypothetical protein